LAVGVGEWSASLPDRFTPGERTVGVHWIRGLTRWQRKSSTASNEPGWPGSSQPLYWLSYAPTDVKSERFGEGGRWEPDDLTWQIHRSCPAANSCIPPPFHPQTRAGIFKQLGLPTYLY